MKSTVYIETTVISYLTAWPSRDLIRAAHQQITREWWRDQRNLFDLVASELVVREARAGDAGAARERIEAIVGLPLLGVSDEATDLAEHLIRSAALPQKAAADALHIAIAAAGGIDYLLTWNCRHLASAVMRDIIQQKCVERGFRPPTICTPEELMGDSAHE